MRKKNNKMTKSDFFSGLFLNSRVLKGTFISIVMNCQAVSFSLHAWLGVCSFLAIIQVIHNSKFPLPSLNKNATAFSDTLVDANANRKLGK